jgi:transcriptional regulator with XRE-family HTH domain
MTKTLRAWRAEQLLSTRRIATLSGTSNKTIVQIENGRQTPTFATIDKISRVLQVEPREVTEFALALAERSRESSVDTPVASTDGRPVAQVLCVSAVASFLTVTRRLLEAERYGVTSMIGVPVTVEQVACLQPDLVILDLGADAQRTIDLTQGLRGSPAMAQLPIVVTGRDRSRMAEAVARLDDAARQGVTLVPFDRELGDLVATVESLTRGQDAEPTE